MHTQRVRESNHTHTHRERETEGERPCTWTQTNKEPMHMHERISNGACPFVRWHGRVRHEVVFAFASVDECVGRGHGRQSGKLGVAVAAAALARVLHAVEGDGRAVRLEARRRRVHLGQRAETVRILQPRQQLGHVQASETERVCCGHQGQQAVLLRAVLEELRLPPGGAALPPHRRVPHRDGHGACQRHCRIVDKQRTYRQHPAVPELGVHRPHIHALGGDLGVPAQQVGPRDTHMRQLQKPIVRLVVPILPPRHRKRVSRRVSE
jgi:hypothetical protein